MRIFHVRLSNLYYRGTSLIRNTHPHRITTGPSLGIGRRATLGSYVGGDSYERGTPVVRRTHPRIATGYEANA